MSNRFHDIQDDEIRIITNENKTALFTPDTPAKKKHRLAAAISIAVAVAIICGFGIWYIAHKIKSDDSSELAIITNENPNETKNTTSGIADSIVATDAMAATDAALGFVIVSDTVINRMPLSIFRPINLTPTLHVGVDALKDSTARFIVQAADIRSDNGGIVGAFVNKGELISKGQAKSGFCAIIGGKINIGVASATPLLEQALETDGYFFRQYPLVVANQIVENKPKGKSLRKALAELNGEPVVIMSREQMTFHDFSQSLIDLGVANAIYLVGGKSYGFAVDADGRKIEFGQLHYNLHNNTNYIVWK